MHIVLIAAPVIHYQRMVPYFPVGILTLHKILTEAGQDCRIYIPHEEAVDKIDLEILINRWAVEIAATKPDCVGFSTMCDSYPLTLVLAEQVKRISPETHILLGGPQATAVAEETLTAFPWIDYVLRGEADRAILEFVQVATGKKSPHEASNLTFRTNGEVQSSPLAPLIGDIDSLVLPDLRVYPYFEQAILLGNYVFDEQFIPLEAGRGCPYQCCFCSTSQFWRRRRRQKSPSLLFEQMKRVSHNYNVRSIFLMQDLFAVQGQWLDVFLNHIDGNCEITWSCALRPDSVSNQTIAKMQRAGCRHIFFGVESGSQKVQNRINKNLDVRKTIETIEAAVGCGIDVMISMVVGFPWETTDDLQKTLSLHQYFLNIGVGNSQVLMLCPRPKTQITIEYASQLLFDTDNFARFTAVEDLRNEEIDQMIRRYPNIFSSFYYLKTEFLPRKEILLAVRAAKTLAMFKRAVQH